MASKKIDPKKKQDNDPAKKRKVEPGKPIPAPPEKKHKVEDPDIKKDDIKAKNNPIYSFGSFDMLQDSSGHAAI